MEEKKKPPAAARKRATRSKICWNVFWGKDAPTWFTLQWPPLPTGELEIESFSIKSFHLRQEDMNMVRIYKLQVCFIDRGSFQTPQQMPTWALLCLGYDPPQYKLQRCYEGHTTKKKLKLFRAAFCLRILIFCQCVEIISFIKWLQMDRFFWFNAWLTEQWRLWSRMTDNDWGVIYFPLRHPTPFEEENVDT